MAENLNAETDSKTEEVTGEVAQGEIKAETVSNEQAAENELNLPKTIEEYKKALQSSSSKKMNEFLKKYNAANLSEIDEKLSKIPEYEKQITDSKATTDRIAEMQKIIDEYKPIVEQKKQADFLQTNNINSEFAEDFFALYEKKLNEDKSNSDEVIKSILEKHPNMSSVKVNDIKTSGSGKEKKDIDDKLEKELNNMRRFAGLPTK